MDDSESLKVRGEFMELDQKIQRNQEASFENEAVLVIYECRKKRFLCSAVEGRCMERVFDTESLWEVMLKNGICTKDTAEKLQSRLEAMLSSERPQACFREYYLSDLQGNWKWYRVGWICTEPGERIGITFTDIQNEKMAEESYRQMMQKDKLTGLLQRSTFCQEVEKVQKTDKEGVIHGEYAMVYFDVIKFKAINEIFGAEQGDRLLTYIARTITKFVKPDDITCRLGSDRFIIFTHMVGSKLEKKLEQMLETISSYELPIAITCSVGIYVTTQNIHSADSMIDRAILAQAAIKGSYMVKYNYYNEDLRNALLGEQEIVGMMEEALQEKQFVIYYQPQYNHSNGMLVGAEALVRWQHPERGLISPGIFIPIFENNGFITELDMYVFEQVCVFLRRCMDQKYRIVPISTNFSRKDIFQPDFVKKLESIRSRYGVPSKYLRVEITESAVMGSSQYTNEIVRELHEHGYIVEMDDFGSGYSSLNVLKDIELDMIKLDMLFMSDNSENNRGGTILSSVVRMAKWLGMPIIAEGVEKVEQADFLKSIGCEYIQGYLYSKPVPEAEYTKLICGSTLGTIVPELSLIDTLNAENFWDPKSIDTLIFSNYVGGAAIFEYQNANVELLRVNKKYLQEIGMNLSEKDVIETDPMGFLDEENQTIYMDMIRRAVESEEEQECETWRTMLSSCCGQEKVCIQSSVRMIGKSQTSYLFYARIRNITKEKEHYTGILDREKRFVMASEQTNIFYWEYTIATKQMRPCFRCMRELGLPALMEDYPNSAIERGIFPPEVADMYRDWHRQLAEGVGQLEAVIPLTAERIPFRVRYTTEFDDFGNPVKAYGSATPVEVVVQTVNQGEV